jgi:LysM repeat protein
MSPEQTSSTTKVCPTCGTRLNENATRCLVCGRTFTSTEKPTTGKSGVQGPHMPEVTLSLPIALGLMVIILGIGAAVVFALLRTTGRVVEPTITPTVTQTATITTTATATLTSTPVPTATPLPPVEYVVAQGDYCSTIAAFFKVSVQSIVLQNSLPADCGTLYVGQKLLVPQPTPTASPMPTATLSKADATEAACDKMDYTVNESDTLSGIAANYNVSIQTLKDYNGLTNDIVYQGQKITIPLCQRLPTPGPTPTPTLPPPYAAANLLLPADGAPYGSGNDTITLQWAAVGTLRENEAYQVNIEDVTEGAGRKLTETVTDTKYIVPISFRPNTTTPHVIRWYIVPVRQMGSSKDGNPIWQPAGAASLQRTFIWTGTAGGGGNTGASSPAPAITTTPTPKP